MQEAGDRGRPPQAAGRQSPYAHVAKCRACGNERLLPILDLGVHALTGRFPGANEPDPPIAPLELVICDTTASPDACGLVQLRHTYNLSEMYGSSYGYRSSITETMVRHLHTTADQTLDLARPAAGDWVLEVGSNDGTIQRYLSGRGLNLVAVDPSAAKYAENYPKESNLIVDFFSLDAVRAVSGKHQFKAIISIAMFYDLERPLDFMREVHDLLEKDGVWCCELAYLPSMFTSLCYDTICHEHLGYYGLRQFDWLATRSGLRLVDVSLNDINGGSFRVLACRDDSTILQHVGNVGRFLSAEKRLNLANASTWSEFSRRVRLHRARLRCFFEDARAAGDLVLGLGASTKGNVILQYAGITPDLMPAIGERDNRKVGLRTPRSGIPIISEEQARKMNPRYFFVGPWHFRSEILSRESEFLRGGGHIVFPLPRFEIVQKQIAPAPAAPAAIHWAKPMLFDDERIFITAALDSTMISGGFFVDKFESDFAKLLGLEQPAISTSNGTSALMLAYLALGIGPGDEIIVPAWGFLAAANMALAIGAKPIFADVDAASWTLNPDTIKAKITPKTRAIVAIHTYGNVCDLSALRRIADDAGLALIEDCAESLGSTWDGQASGTIGDVGTFSFQATKILTSGEGGAIVCRSQDVADRARLIRSHAMKGQQRYWHHDVGHNFRLTNIQCAMLCAQLGHWKEVVGARARLHEAYRLRLDGTPGLTFQTFGAQVRPVVWATALLLDGATIAVRDRLLQSMLEAGIECRPGFYPPSAQPIYGVGALPVSDRIAGKIIVPPIDATLTEEALDTVCDVFLASLKRFVPG
jgi:NDP-4-keto-2,6-dideoxyhexose 3-C-methyltransferase